MKQLIEKLVPRGFMIMFIGMTIAIAGVGFNCYISDNLRYVEQGPWMIPASVVIAFVGFAVYIFGRILLYIQRKNISRENRERVANINDEE